MPCLCLVLPSYLACLPCCTSQTHTFACLFEGYGGTATAAYLQKSAYAVFCTAMRRCSNTAEALEAMMPELDDALVRTAKSDLVSSVCMPAGNCGA